MVPGSSILKRKISWSDDCSTSDDGNGSPNGTACDELSRHSKIARTHLDIAQSGYTASDPVTLRGDDGNDTENSSLESQKEIEVAWTRPSRREDIVWPEFPSTSPHCCVKCRTMTGTPEGLAALLGDGGYKHFNWYEIQEMAALGCALCTALWDVTENEDWDYEEDGSVTRSEIRIFANVTDLSSPSEGRLSEYPLENIQLHSFDVQFPEDPFPRILDIARLNLVTFETDPASSFVLGRRESKELNPQTVNKIRGWLDDCLNNHPSCPRSCTPELPRRVLDVGIDNSTVRLHQSLENEKSQYASLSYCWGSDGKQIMTTNSNLHDHFLALPRHLPKTIFDAIEVCRKVGIRYLWIDALCIIQDNSSDKLDHIANMGSIYKNSTVTIVAASAERVTDGFLSNEKPSDEDPIIPIAQLPIFIDNSTSGTLYLRREESDWIFSSDEPISQRGWTLQELLLSPRALIFDSSQITLKCIEHDFQPVFDTYVNFDFGPGDLPVSIFGLVDKHFAGRDTQESREDYLKDTQYKTWKKIIYEYSQRNLTLFDDRLPALAGIATELSKAWKDVYLVGFWKKTITKHLGWYRSQPPSRRTGNSNNFEGVERNKRIGSPSWSWVTAPFSVEIRDCKYPDAKLIDSGVLLESQKSPFGKVNNAFIALEARVLKASDLGLTMKFQSWPTSPHDDIIGLDFEAPKPDLGNCRLVHLGQWKFLVVEKSLGGKFQRVGYTELSRWKEKWENLMSSAKREITVIE